jgi:hypothetical protein
MIQMQVWLPVKTTAFSDQIGFTALPDEQVNALIKHYRAVQGDIVCPEPLGQREKFLWQLQADLAKTATPGPAFADFALLIEATVYGLLRPVTYDISQSGFALNTNDRYLTLLTYQPNRGAPASVAGFFSPTTLVCPAANWTSRQELTQHVQQLRDMQQGNGGRALLRSFHEQFRDTPMIWLRGIAAVLAAYPVTALDPGEMDQANLGPFLLQMAPSASPQTVFLPSYFPGRLPAIIHRLQGNQYQGIQNGVAVMYNGQTLCHVVVPRSARPKLFGLGWVEITQASQLPAQTTFNNKTKDDYKHFLAQVVNAYQSEIVSPDPRFLLPDVLRAVFLALGRPTAVALLTGASAKWLYSDSAVAASFNVLPHQSNLQPGSKQTVPEGIYFADALPDGRLALYLQRWNGKEFGELTAIGSALWQVFRANGSSQNANSPANLAASLFTIVGGRLNTESPMRAPIMQQDALSWSDFLYWLQHQNSSLLYSSATEFASVCGLSGVGARQRSVDTRVIKIGHHDWRIPK